MTIRHMIAAVGVLLLVVRGAGVPVRRGGVHARRSRGRPVGRPGGRRPRAAAGDHGAVPAPGACHPPGLAVELGGDGRRRRSEGGPRGLPHAVRGLPAAPAERRERRGAAGRAGRARGPGCAGGGWCAVGRLRRAARGAGVDRRRRRGCGWCSPAAPPTTSSAPWRRPCSRRDGAARRGSRRSASSTFWTRSRAPASCSLAARRASASPRSHSATASSSDRPPASSFRHDLGELVARLLVAQAVDRIAHGLVAVWPLTDPP